MKGKQILFAIVLVIGIVNCKIGVHLDQPQATSFFKCLKIAGFDWITMFIDSNSKGVAPEYVQSLYNANNGGLKV